jgi:benzylsuccinate CoA-transferase BbsE subunit
MVSSPPAATGLAGCRVLDLTGPGGQYCGKLLADLGADVIKIEPPAGDPARRLGPFQDSDPERRQSLFFAYYNTNKRSLVLDRDLQPGREVFERLLSTADAVIETVEVDRAPPSLDFAALARSHPRLVLTTIEGFGSGGPYESYRTTSLVAFAMSGIMKGIGPADGPPAEMPGQIALDIAAADAAAGTLLALLARRRSGRGQHVQVAAFEVLAAQLGAPGTPRHDGRRTGWLHLQLGPSGIYPCRDGAVEFSTLLPGQWQRLKVLLVDAEELQEPHWDDRAYRIANADRLYGIVAAAVKDRTKAELTEQAQRLQIPCLPVNAVADVIANEHIQARGFFRETETPDLGRIAFPGAPYRLSEERWRLRRPAPALGQHTADILTGALGYSEPALVELAATGAVGSLQ